MSALLLGLARSSDGASAAKIVQLVLCLAADAELAEPAARLVRGPEITEPAAVAEQLRAWVGAAASRTLLALRTASGRPSNAQEEALTDVLTGDLTKVLAAASRRRADASATDTGAIGAGIGDALGDLLAAIRDQQVEAALTWEARQAADIVVPFQFGGETRLARLRVRGRDGRRPASSILDEHVPFLSVLVELPTLGEVHGDVQHVAGVLAVDLAAADETAAATIRRRLADLRAELRGVGFPVVRADVRVDPVGIERAWAKLPTDGADLGGPGALLRARA
ncbi:MAG: flagellar hook-length control protein FliK [Vicinamibacterales bacterium]